MQNFYCEYCGRKFPDVRTLSLYPCPKHPIGANKGNHKLYEGSEKHKYTCKYCGRQFHSIMEMTMQPCRNNPLGANKGNCCPAL